jgi:hypothetical protein
MQKKQGNNVLIEILAHSSPELKENCKNYGKKQRIG